ncbi:MAG: hypothetical protein VYE64_08505, partial [Planctomycetota bacterium]|nr:hypothetical protein [Planctomycetota bacterium]
AETVVTSASTYGPKNESSTVVQPAELPNNSESAEKPPVIYYGKPIYVEPKEKETNKSTTGSKSVLTPSSEEPTEASSSQTEMATVTPKTEPANGVDKVDNQSPKVPSEKTGEPTQPTEPDAKQEIESEQKLKTEAADTPPSLNNPPEKDAP